MVGMRRDTSIEAVARELQGKAAELWGEEMPELWYVGRSRRSLLSLLP